jgi:hypothetical protein
VGILLLTLYFCVKCFVDHCLSLCPSVLSGILLLSLYFSVKCFVDHCVSLCPSVVSGDIVTQSFLFCEVFCRSLFVPLSFHLMGILLLSLYFSVKCFVDHCLSLYPSVLSEDLVAQSLLFYEVFCRSLFVPLSFRFCGDLVAQFLLFCEVFCRSLFVPLSFRS